MGSLGSAFIMDVSNSGAMLQPSKLTAYLHHMASGVDAISKRNPGTISFTHRRGDEVFLVARGFETAYIFAFYIAITWPFFKHPPYFGIAFGNLLADFPASQDLETWNSPVANWARLASDELKKQRSIHRPYLLFEGGGGYGAELTSALNEYGVIQDRFLKLQTDVERVTSALCLISGVQGWVASELGKNRSTISRQISSSNVDIVVMTKNRIVDTLRRLETAGGQEDLIGYLGGRVGDRDRAELVPQIADVETQIKNELKTYVRIFLDNIGKPN